MLLSTFFYFTLSVYFILDPTLLLSHLTLVCFHSETFAKLRETFTGYSHLIQGVNTFYREAGPPEGVTGSGEVVVLLHGAAFQSKTWLDLNTINILAAMGHRVIAVDLPGQFDQIFFSDQYFLG